MKIGIYDPYLDDVGGGEKYMLTLAECISKDNDVSIFWNNRKDFERVVERFGINRRNIHIEKNIFSSQVGFFERLFATQQYDAIIFLSDGSIPLILSKKLFVHVQQPLQKFQSHSLKDKLKLSRVTKFFCNSNFTKTFIGDKYGLKTVVIYPPVILHPKNVKRENIILHVGRFRRVSNVSEIDDYKKQGIMVYAFKNMVKNGFLGWKFVLAVSINQGQEKEFEDLKKDAKGFPIEFLVNKTNDELWNVYSKSKIYWHASGYGEDLNKHPEYAEHFGISTVEAMGGGCVPVVINAGGQKEIVTNGENGLLWNSLEELQEETITVAKNIQLWERLSENARKRAQEFAGDRFCREVEQLISNS